MFPVQSLLIVLLCFAWFRADGAPGDLIWQRELGSCIVGAPAYSATGRILVATCDGTIHCITTVGSNSWSYSTSADIVGVPTVAEDGTIYFGSDKLYALNADGSKRWDFVLETSSSWSIRADDPVIGPDGVVYVARPFAPNGERRLYAINPDGTLRWKVDGRFLGELSVGIDGSVLAPGSWYGSFTSVNPDGTTRWTYDAGNYVVSSAAVAADGTVLVPVNGGSFYDDGAVQASTPAGSNLWRFAGGGQALGSPVVGPEGNVYYAFDNGRVVALESDGQLLWEYTMPGTNSPGRIEATPALASDGTLYFAGEHYLHALNANGQLSWRFDGGSNELRSPLIGPGGRVYVGDSGGVLYAVQGTGAGLAASQWPMSRRNGKHQASAAGALSAPPAPAGLTASLTNFTDRVLVTWTSAPPATHYVVVRSGTTNFADAQVLADSITGTTIFEDRSAMAGVTYYYFVQGRNQAGISAPVGPAPGARRVAAIGEVVWALPTGGSAFPPAMAQDGTLVFGSSDGKLYAANPDGSLRWTFTFGGASCSPPSIDSDGSVYFSAAISRYPATTTNALFALNPDGQLRWRILSGASEVSGPAIGADGTVYVASGDYNSAVPRSVKAISPLGSNLWSFANGRNFLSTPSVGADGTIYAGTVDGVMEALRPDGTLLWECPTGDGYLQTPVIDSNGVLFTAGGSFHAINMDGQKLWSYALQSGANSGPSCLDPAGVLYAQADYTYYRMNPNGLNVQKFTLPASMSTLQPVFRDASGTIYTMAYGGSYGGAIIALSSAGAEQWHYGGYNMSFSGAVLGTNNTLCVSGEDGRLYAVRTAAGLDNSAWPHPLHDPQHTARAAQVPPAPGAPAGLSATMRTRVTDVRITWNSALRAVGYDLYRSTTTNVADAVLLASVAGTLSYDDASVLPEHAYTYWVKARNAVGSSAFSEPASGMRRQAVTGELLYEWNLFGEIDTSPAIAEDGTVYVSANYPVSDAPDAGRKVVAVRPDGTIRWQYLTGLAMLSSPSVGADGTIYVGIRGALNLFPYASPLIALRPDGTLRWQIMADDAIETTPVIGQDGTIYVGSTLGTLYAVSAEGGLLWTNRLGSSIGALAIGRDGTLYGSSADGYLTAMQPDGTTVWRVKARPTTSGESELPGLALGKDGAMYVSCGSGGLKAFNTDGTLRWQHAQGNSFYASPIVGLEDTILVGNNVGSGSTFWCFGPGGTNVWGVDGGGSHGGAAVVSADGTALISGNGARLSAFSTTGSNVWQLALGSASSSSPAIAPDGTIYIGGDDGKLRSVYGTSPLAGTPWPMFQRDARHTGCDVHAPVLPDPAGSVLATDGTYNDRIRITWITAPAARTYEVWRMVITDPGSVVCLATNVAGQTFSDDKSAVPGTIYYYWVRSVNGVGAAPFSGPDFGYRRVAVPGESLGDSRPLGAASTSPSLGNDGDIYVGGSGLLYALNAELTNDWQFSLGSVSTPTVGDNGQIFVWVANNRFYALDPSGTAAWWFAGRCDVNLPAAQAEDGALVIADRNQTVSCFDPVAQSLRWQYAAGSAITAAPAIGVDGAVFLGSQDGQLHALNADGSLRWRFRTGGRIQSSPAVGANGVVYFGSDDRGIYAVGPDGRRLWAAQARGIVSASPVIAPDGTVIVGSQDGRLYAFSPEGTERWEFVANGAIHGSACVGSDGIVYFGTFNGWVYALDRDGLPVWSFNSTTNGLSGSVLQSPLLIQDRLLVPISSAGLQALAVSAGPAEVNWPQYRHDVQRTARAHTLINLTLPDTPGKIAGEELALTVGLDFDGHTIVRLDLLCGTNVLATVTGPGPVITWSPVIEGSYFLSVRAVDDAGNMHLSAPYLADIAPPPRLTISRPALSNAQLSFNTLAGRSYQVQRSVDLRIWISVGPPVTATSSHLEWTDPDGSSREAYYRVQLLPGATL